MKKIKDRRKFLKSVRDTPDQLPPELYDESDEYEWPVWEMEFDEVNDNIIDFHSIPDDTYDFDEVNDNIIGFDRINDNILDFDESVELRNIFIRQNVPEDIINGVLENNVINIVENIPDGQLTNILVNLAPESLETFDNIMTGKTDEGETESILELQKDIEDTMDKIRLYSMDTPRMESETIIETVLDQDIPKTLEKALLKPDAVEKVNQYLEWNDFIENQEEIQCKLEDLKKFDNIYDIINYIELCKTRKNKSGKLDGNEIQKANFIVLKKLLNLKEKDAIIFDLNISKLKDKLSKTKGNISLNSDDDEYEIKPKKKPTKTKGYITLSSDDDDDEEYQYDEDYSDL